MIFIQFDDFAASKTNVAPRKSSSALPVIVFYSTYWYSYITRITKFYTFPHCSVSSYLVLDCGVHGGPLCLISHSIYLSFILAHCLHTSSFDQMWCGMTWCSNDACCTYSVFSEEHVSSSLSCASCVCVWDRRKKRCLGGKFAKKGEWNCAWVFWYVHCIHARVFVLTIVRRYHLIHHLVCHIRSRLAHFISTDLPIDENEVE